jgi:O-antigen/teichoic acid export membrane protein
MLKTLITKLDKHQGFKKYFFNTSWMFAEQILRLVAGLLVGVWVARYLGPDKFGIYSYAVAFVSLFGAASKMGLDNIIVRDLVHYPDKRDEYLGTAFWLKVAGAIVSMGILTIAVKFISKDTTINLYIFIIASGLIFQSFDVVDFYFQSKVLSKYVSICRMVQLALSSILKLYLIFIKADLFWFVLVVLIDNTTLAITLAIAYWRQKLGYFFNSFVFSTAKKMLKSSWPLILASIVIMIYMRIDQIMIKEMLGEHEVGLYSAAVRLSEIWYFIPVIVVNSLFPAIVNAKRISAELYQKRLQRLYSLMAWMAIGIAVPMTFLSEWLVVLLYGNAYKQAGQVLMIHIWASVFVFLGVAFGRYLTAENLNIKLLYRTLLGATSNVLLNLILIPKYGIRGAAISLFLSQLMANYIYDLFDKSLYPQLKLKTIAIINPLCIKNYMT